MTKTLLALAASLGFTALPAMAAPELKDCKMEYPRAALLNEEQGTVHVAVKVGADGKIADAKIAKGSGHRSLDVATLSQVKACQAGNQPRGEFTVEFVWKLS